MNAQLRECWRECFSLKVARPLPADRNRPDVPKQVDYTNWFMGHAVLYHSVFVDESGYNRERSGERVYRQVCGQRGKT